MIQKNHPVRYAVQYGGKIFSFKTGIIRSVEHGTVDTRAILTMSAGGLIDPIFGPGGHKFPQQAAILAGYFQDMGTICSGYQVIAIGHFVHARLIGGIKVGCGGRSVHGAQFVRIPFEYDSVILVVQFDKTGSYGSGTLIAVIQDGDVAFRRPVGSMGAKQGLVAVISLIGGSSAL